MQGHDSLCKLFAQIILDLFSLVHAKYHFHGSWLHYCKPRHCSIIWEKICAVGLDVHLQFQRLIGSDKPINVYTDPWIFSLPLAACPTYFNIDARYLHMSLA